MTDPFAGRVNDSRGFVHRKIAGIAATLTRGIPIVGGAVGLANQFIQGGSTPGVPGRCPSGSLPNASGACVQTIVGSSIPGSPSSLGFPQDPRDIVSDSPGFGRPPGEAVLGIYGAALQPSGEMRHTRSCIRGMVLGTDGLCYNKANLSNKERFWPRGRRPLLTGGEMRAIGIASTAAKKLQAAQKRLMTLGLMKKPAVRRAPQQKLLTKAPPGTSIINVE